MKQTQKRTEILRRNFILALIYTIGGPIFAFVAFSGMVAMWFSGNFLVVYDKSWNIIWTVRLLRYGLYAVLAIAVIAGILICSYGIEYLAQRWQKRFGRC